MLFADSFGDGFLLLVLMVSIGLWSMKRLMSKFDSGGAVKGAAKKGAFKLLEIGRAHV